MESYKTAMSLIFKHCYMVVIDLKDAYHAIPVHNNSQKYLKFRWTGTLYKYTCIPFGLCLAPWLYSKLNKPIMAHLRSIGLVVVSYLDDTLLICRTKAECKKSLKMVMGLFASLGLTVNLEKSQCHPSQKVRFLGFSFDSVDMCMVLPESKQQKVILKCKEILIR